MKHKIVILQHRLLHYRVDFFEKLKKKCKENSIELHLIHGQASETEKSKKDEGFIVWAEKIKNTHLRLSYIDLIWQHLPNHIYDADLIILMQENRILSNYPFLFFKHFFHSKIAFWGHGANFQSTSPNGLREKWKKLMAKRVDWWFGYTQITKDILLSLDFPDSKITTLNNTIDTKKFVHDYQSISKTEALNKRKSIGIPEDAKVGVFCGSLYQDKKIELLLQSSEILRNSLNFHLIFIGSGPKLSYLEDYSKNNPWVHLVGVKKDREKALYFKMSEVMLNPGALGLHIIDSFSVGIPLISTTNAIHGPEISYLINNFNGILTGDTPEIFSNAVRNICIDSSYYNRISQNALKSADLYTIDQMVDNFYDGVKRCIST